MTRKVKVKKKKIRIVPLLIFLVVLIVLILCIKMLLSTKTHNIIITGNNILSDQTIIEEAGLTNYPEYFKVSTRKMKKKLKHNPYIKDVKIERRFFNIFKINIVEEKVLLYDFPNQNYILSNGEVVISDKDFLGVPTLLNHVSDTVYDRFVKKLDALDTDVLKQISEIKYDPSSYDETRFFLTMNDGNYVYINIPNFKSLDLYNKIYPNFDGHKGILFLDSGYGEASEYKIIK
ncbi:MAG: FtsQ-type POTRA domain-containing protein [Bacilli bacterium]|nr:FtsQ-type POTRA domain-containing protein [Bacilli bacterium]